MKSKFSYYHFLFVLVAVVLVIHVCLSLFTRFERTITVKSNESYRTKRITDTENRVYIVANDFLQLHFTSAEVFGMMQVGKTYKVKGYGLRVPVLGMFPNITSAQSA